MATTEKSARARRTTIGSAAGTPARRQRSAKPTRGRRPADTDDPPTDAALVTGHGGPETS